ncbi:MAG: site-specific integrase [Rhodovibrio sp.]|nr:site-specific integrase [Rhodovibrio sp.]
MLTEQELKRVMAVVAEDRYAARNRVALALSFYAGLRVGEIANLKVWDVVDRDGHVREEIRLLAGYTKGKQARTAFVNRRLHKELQRYVAGLPDNVSPDRPLLQTQKGLCVLPQHALPAVLADLLQLDDAAGFVAQVCVEFSRYCYGLCAVVGLQATPDIRPIR